MQQIGAMSQKILKLVRRCPHRDAGRFPHQASGCSHRRRV